MKKVKDQAVEAVDKSMEASTEDVAQVDAGGAMNWNQRRLITGKSPKTQCWAI